VVQRHCGDCTLCCRLLPVLSIGKPGGVRCRHQRRTGCRVYHGPEFPLDCRAWSCMWLTGEAGDIGRPDHSHVVVDPHEDFVTLVEERALLEVRQFWVDPRHRDAWRVPAVMTYMDELGRRNVASILRFDSRDDALVVFPPSMTGDRWLVREANVVSMTRHLDNIASAVVNKRETENEPEPATDE
jgi:hypothetical protein